MNILAGSAFVGVWKILISIVIGIAGFIVATILSLFGSGSDPNTGRSSSKNFFITLAVTAVVILVILLV